MFAPIRIVESIAAHAFTAGWRVHELIVTDIDADVRRAFAFLVEKHEVAAAKIAGGDFFRVLFLFAGTTRDVDAGLAVAVLHQAAAIEAMRVFAAVTIGFADHGERGIGGARRVFSRLRIR